MTTLRAGYGGVYWLLPVAPPEPATGYTSRSSIACLCAYGCCREPSLTAFPFAASHGEWFVAMFAIVVHTSPPADLISGSLGSMAIRDP